MTAPTATASPLTTSLSGDGPRVLINRASEAERLAEFITRAKSRFVVLYGQPSSGKTTLVKNWLLPALKAMQEVGKDHVFYGACTTALPDSVDGEGGPARFDELIATRSILILDEFDHILDAPRDDRRTQLDALFTRLHRKDALGVVVAVVAARQLTSVYALTSYEPGIVGAVEAMGTVSLSDGLQRLCNQERNRRRITYSAATLAAIEAEAKENGLIATFDFVRLIHARFDTVVTSDPHEISLDDYASVGRLEGILREYVERCLDTIEAEKAGSAAIAQAILLRVLEAQSRAAPTDLSDIGPRLEKDSGEVARVANALVVWGLLLQVAADQYQFHPPQVASIIEADRAARQAENDRARRIVAEGLRSWQLLGTMLPAARFAEINRQRYGLTLDDEATRFIVQCALRQEQLDLDDVQYWLARMSSPDDRMDVLLAALFDTPLHVRLRAARLLGQFADPLVRERLCVLALSDASPDVRSAAIDSLSKMPSDGLFESLRREIDNPRNPNREHAVEALRLFRGGEATGLLRSLVGDPASPQVLRERAIGVLATLHTNESVDVLVDIALEDEDRADREAAAQSLGKVPTEELNRYLLSRLSWRRPVLRMLGMILLLSVLLYVGAMINVLVVSLATGSMTPKFIGRMVAGTIFVSVVTGALLTGIEEGRVKRRSVAGILGLILFIISSVTYVVALHGLAHLMVRRTRRAAALFGLELAGLAFYFLVAGAAESIIGLGFLAVVYKAIGVILFVGSYFYDVLRVTLDLFVMRRAMAREARRSAIYQEVFDNPAMTATVIADLGSPDPRLVRRARSLIRRFGGRMAPSALVDRIAETGPSRRYVVSALSRAKDDETVSRLATTWRTSSASTRRSIASTLARSPTAAAIDTLSRLTRESDIVVRIRAWIARLQFSLDVWPRWTQAAIVVLLPVVGMLLYHGGMMAQNHAWGEIILLRQPISSPERKVRIVDFLVDVYPDKSADELRRIFKSGEKRPIDPVHAAVTRGLVRILDSADRGHTDTLRLALGREIARFDTLLRGQDTAKFAMAIGVLGTMARSSDSVLADRAVALITAAADSNARQPNGSPTRLDSAVQVLSRARYDRALPALSRVLKAIDSKKVPSRTDVDQADMIQLEMNRVANQAFATLPTGDDAARTHLRQTLANWLPNRTGKDLVEQLDKQQLASKCDRNADGKCDGKDDALHVIDQSPETEAGYRDLYRHYGADGQYHDAVPVFTHLAEQHPKSIWPLKILAEIYHENLFTESESFAKSYDAMIALRQLAAYHELNARHDDDYRRIEADFAEIALSAGHARDVAVAASGVLSSAPTATQRLNMALFLYIAGVVDHDGTAPARLNRLEAVVDSLPPQFSNEWFYPGTKAFIGQSNLTDSLKAALTALCKEGDWYTIADAKRIIAMNRREITPPSRT